MTIKMLEFFIISLLLLLTPGFTFLCITRIWRDWPALQRWIAAAGISLAFYPVFFYLTREIVPGLQLGPRKLWAMLILFGSITLVYFWKERKTLFRLKPLEWVAVAILAVTVLTRFWAITDRPYPAWTDALHHVLITQLTAQNGQLPYSLEPYAPTPLDMYHLGLYSLTGPVKILTGLPAHTSFLWLSQLLNGLCGLGIYLFLDRKVGRRAALIGLVAVGLWSFQPAWYVNWSRSTSLASNTLLFVTALITWEALTHFVKGEGGVLGKLSYIGVGALMNAGVFLYHFRVAGYYLPLLLLICIWLLWDCGKQGKLKTALLGLSLTGFLTLVLISPVLISALSIYLERKSAVSVSGQDLEYYVLPLSAIFLYATQRGLLILTGLAAIIGLIFRNRIVFMILIWVAFLSLEANAYLLNIPVLAFTNPFGILVILYLPIAILMGSAVGVLFDHLDKHGLKNLSNALLVVSLLSGLWFIPQRINGIDTYRYFMTSADEQAMEWISSNTPEDALIAVNTFLWMGTSPQGTDGGYWIPYFTGRQTTTSTMLFSLGPDDYIQDIQQDSFIVEAFETDPSRINDLCATGVDYVYIGLMGDYSSRGLTPELLEQVRGDRLVYNEDGVSIYQICIND
jgi:hypothetical protein